MSLEYETIRSYLKPWVDVSEDDKARVIGFMKATDKLWSDDMQWSDDIYDLLFGKIRKTIIGIERNDMVGINIFVTYVISPQNVLSLHFVNKKSREISLIMDSEITRGGYGNPSVILQKLLLDRLPLNVRNILMYYIYNPNKHDMTEIEQYTGPVRYSEENIELKSKVNYPPKWRMNNKWEEVSNFVFSLIESLHHTKYNEGFEYPITLDLKVCKEMCREDEESIVINKTFQHRPRVM